MNSQTDARSCGEESCVVDGLVPERVVSVSSVSEVSETLRAAAADGQSVIPWGGGSQIGLGNIPAAYDVALDLSGLGDVLRYEADDMTISLGAGCRLGHLNAMLDGHRQMLPVDVADPRCGTIGGMVAAGLSGPRRLGYGPLRDLIIGVAVAYPDGSIGKAGGLVVKNVTGYDLMRLHHGALGSLGVIVSVNLKVIPKPSAQQAVIASYDDMRAAFNAAMHVRLSTLGPTALVALDPLASARVVHDDPECAWTVLARAEASPAACARQAQRLADMLSQDASALRIVEDTAETEALWEQVSTFLAADPSESEIGVRIGAAPSNQINLAESLAEFDARYDSMLMSTRTMFDVGGGLTYRRATVETSAAGQETWADAWASVIGLGQHATLLTAPTALKRSVDVFGDADPQGIDVMRALKHQFDPAGTLNRGRYIGRL
jgi:glycolate oxidase FAD binding subunit